MSLLGILRTRLGIGRRTLPVPAEGAKMSPAFRGRLALDDAACKDGCRACADACPTGAITAAPLAVDLGACLFCPACVEACPSGGVRFTQDQRLATRTREGLRYGSGGAPALAAALDAKARSLFGRSLRLRQVSAAGCNGCEAELNASMNVDFDAWRFGVQWVASPRHADGVVITGPVSANMESALLDTWAATPSPRLVIAVGACAISGGVFAGGPEVRGIPAELKVDLFVPGCPPHPLTFVDAVARLLGRL
jgi:Ni,Fe-hydrogenase III small subunit/ferredoxin